MKLKQLLLVVAVSALSAIGSVWIYSKTTGKSGTASFQQANGNVPVNYAGFFDNAAGAGEPIDFTKAANAAVPAVVHIKTKIAAKKTSNRLGNRSQMDDLFEQFFGPGTGFGPQMQPEQRASGSGVIISEDGYIITNNHVVSDGGNGVADEITVTLSNKKTYKARVIGKDPSSDIAVLKVDGNNLPFLLFGNSDNVKLGQWVLAIGYPLTLETTVTAGIVSAKGRNIGINGRQSDTPIESFIQTDAAVNQGNSGGALITTDGQLIGINSAIYAPTGTYAGYSFAIPINLAKKIVNDLIKFGDVKRPYLGISADEFKVNSTDGAYVGNVATDGAAAKAGIRKGDVITRINEVPIGSWTELQAAVASLNAGDKVTVVYKRNGAEATTTAILKGETGKYEDMTAVNIGDVLGAELVNIDKATAEKNDVDGGVKVKKITKGGPFSKTRMETDFIITSVNDITVRNLDELRKALLTLKDETLNMEGFYEGFNGFYRYPVTLQRDE